MKIIVEKLYTHDNDKTNELFKINLIARVYHSSYGSIKLMPWLLNTILQGGGGLSLGTMNEKVYRVCNLSSLLLL